MGSITTQLSQGDVMGKELKIQGIMLTNEIYMSKKDIEKIREFRQKHLNMNCDIIIVPYNEAEYWMHKYFHGFVLPDICEGMGERNDYWIRSHLKEKFLRFPINSSEEIPRRHAKKCQVIEREVMDENGSAYRRVVAYIPSLSSISYDEYAAFIKKCEDLRDGLEGWGYEEGSQRYTDMVYARDKALHPDSDQGKLF
jgi:hypothetical protein